MRVGIQGKRQRYKRRDCKQPEGSRAEGPHQLTRFDNSSIEGVLGAMEILRQSVYRNEDDKKI